jgi:hypothetical protein
MGGTDGGYLSDTSVLRTAKGEICYFHAKGTRARLVAVDSGELGKLILGEDLGTLCGSIPYRVHSVVVGEGHPCPIFRGFVQL